MNAFWTPAANDPMKPGNGKWGYKNIDEDRLVFAMSRGWQIVKEEGATGRDLGIADESWAFAVSGRRVKIWRMNYLMYRSREDYLEIEVRAPRREAKASAERRAKIRARLKGAKP